MILTHLVFFSFLNGAGGSAPPPVVTGKTGTGGIDRHSRITKPTGLLERKAKPKLTLPAVIEERIQEAEHVAREIAARTAQEILDAELYQPIRLMTQQQIDAEIGRLLRKKIRTEEDEIMLLLIMVAASC